MGLTKQYLRYAPSGIFNVIASPDCNCTHVTLNGVSGRYIAVGACEHVIIWDMRLGEKVYFNICKSTYNNFPLVHTYNLVRHRHYKQLSNLTGADGEL